MKRVLSKILLYFLLLNGSFSYTQKENPNDWTEKELMYYETLKKLADYVGQEDKISKDTLFQKFIYFDNVLGDSDEDRKKRRLMAFDTVFSFIPKTVKSYGIENLEAKPLRFYNNHKIYTPFERALKGVSSDVLVYYRKETPNDPLGTLLFEPNSKKLIAWILLNQGDNGWFFLTFNLL